MDVHVPSAITRGLRARGVEVITAQEDNTDTWSDDRLLDRSTALGCVLFTQDADLLAEAAHRQATGGTFAGVVYGHQQRVSIGQCVADLELLAGALEPLDMLN